MERLKIPIASKSAVGIYGRSQDHSDLYDHLTSEVRKIAVVEGNNYSIWDPIPNRPNHKWDAFVGCCVLATYNGIDPLGKAVNSNSGRRKKKYYSSQGVCDA